MSSWCWLKFDGLWTFREKSEVPDEFIFLFQENERRVVQSLIPPDEADDDANGITVTYEAPREAVLRRLDIAGYTAEFVRERFADWWAEADQQSSKDFELGKEWAEEERRTLDAIADFDRWAKRAASYVRQRRERTSNKLKSGEVYFHFSHLEFDRDLLTNIRAALEAIPETRTVALDISELIADKWLETDELICAERRWPHVLWRSPLQPTMIIAEGSTDIAVLQRSLDRLFPELSDYVTFFDYQGVKVDGGAGQVVRFLKAFAAARISTPILAIFDNDATGHEAFEQANALDLPGHIRATTFPDIRLASDYPTIGPQGEYRVDVNGRAASIELYLGMHNLEDENGALMPVYWANHVRPVDRYQGALREKGDVFNKFMRETKDWEEGVDYRARFPELVVLWEHIFEALKSLRQW